MFQYQPIIQPLVTGNSYELAVLRLDQIDPEISGNKWFKLKHNLKKALEENYHTIITFGGAHSNHIAATAAAAKKAGIKAIGIIRGDETPALNPTLNKAVADGMALEFVSRSDYSKKNEPDFREALQEKYGRHYLIPEGGNNAEGAFGCMEILQEECLKYDYVLCACGTGTTFAGLVASCAPHQTVLGVSVLRGQNSLPDDAEKLLSQMNLSHKATVNGNEELQKSQVLSHAITNNYCFSGYAGFDKELIAFKTDFEKKHSLPLDYIYTNKLFYAAFDLMAKNLLKENSKVLLLHSGGLQGNAAFEKRYHLNPIL